MEKTAQNLEEVAPEEVEGEIPTGEEEKCDLGGSSEVASLSSRSARERRGRERKRAVEAE